MKLMFLQWTKQNFLPKNFAKIPAISNLLYCVCFLVVRSTWRQHSYILNCQLSQYQDEYFFFFCKKRQSYLQLKKKAMYKLEKQMQYQRKCLYELCKTKLLLNLLCLLKILLYSLCKEMIWHTWALYSTICLGFSVSFVLFCTLNRCDVLFSVRKPSLFSYRNSSYNTKNGILSPQKNLL